MDIKKLAIEMLMSKLGSGSNPDVAESALNELTDGDKAFDIGDVVGMFTGAGGNVADKVKSWLGDGSNEAISGSQIEEVIGGDKLEAFATKLGIDRNQASSGLSEVLPQLIDKGSSGGSLLGSIGGAGGLAKLAAKFFK